MLDELGPTEVFPIGQFLAEEMVARGWKCTDVASRMGGEWLYDIFAINIMLCIPPHKIKITDEFDRLGKAFDVSPDYFRNLHDGWMKWPNRRNMEFECPEEILDGIMFPANDGNNI